jgi:alkylation response protein AidB-like acyl-CoA dehydrogenase
VRTARELRPVIEAGAAEGELLAAVPDVVIRALCESGIWGLRVPRQFGGAEVDARTYLDAIDELSYADGSTGWTVMAGGFAGGAGVVLGPSAAARIYEGDEGIIAAAQISALGRAVRVAGGYRVSAGHFHFGSAALYASWFGGAFAVEEDGRPMLNERGRPTVIMCFTSRDQVRLKPNWDVVGLAATGSHDFDFVDQEIPDDWVAGLPGRPRLGGPIYAVGVSMGHVAWALGVGRRALDEIHALATSKRRFARTTLIDQPSFQIEYGRHLAALRAARELVHTTYDEWYQAAQHGPVPLETRASARLAACHATETALRAAQFAMFAAGSHGVRNQDGSNRLQRAFRDLQTGATHRQVDHDVLVESAQVALGIADSELEL